MAGQGKLDSVFTGVNGVANRLINKFGGNISVSYSSGGTYDPVTFTWSGGMTVSYSTAATPPVPYSKADIDGTTILMGDLRTIVPAYQAPAEPPKGATVTFDGQTWSIQDVEIIKSGIEVAAYDLRLRRV